MQHNNSLLQILVTILQITQY